MQRILVVMVNWLGDAILTTPVFKALRKQYPKAYIGVMVVERVKDIFVSNPYIDEVIVFDERGKNKSLLAKLIFVFKLRRKKFDTAFFIHRSFTRIFLAFLGGIKTRIGYERKKTGFLLTKKIPGPNFNLHREDIYLEIFLKTGVIIEDKEPEVFIPKNIIDDIKGKILNLKKIYPVIIGVNPSANWDLKRWPGESFAQLIDRLSKNPKWLFIFIGAKKDKDYVNKVVDLIKTKQYIDWSGQTDFLSLAALIKEMSLFISNDSGPAHLAGALGIHTIVLFGPTDPYLTCPRGKFVEIIHSNVDCKIPCYNLYCKDNQCMKQIKVEQVEEKVKGILCQGKE